MKLIEPDELNEFHAVLTRFNLPTDDFDLREIDTTDPKTDEIFALTGFVIITRISTDQQKEYPIGDGSKWVEEFQTDVAEKLFGDT